jgi:hypothetical protein
MRENCTSGLEGGGAERNRPSLPLSKDEFLRIPLLSAYFALIFLALSDGSPASGSRTARPVSAAL